MFEEARSREEEARSREEDALSRAHRAEEENDKLRREVAQLQVSNMSWIMSSTGKLSEGF